MNKALLTLMAAAFSLTAAAQYQFADPGFEGMDNTTPYNEWSSFESAGGSLTNFAGMSPAPSRVEGFESLYALQVHSAFAGIGIVGANANGNVTTGTVMMGNMKPTNVNNYNVSNKKLSFAGRPDAVSCDAIFTSGGSPNGRGRFILHGDVNYRDPEISASSSSKAAASWQEATADMVAGHIGEASIIITPTGGEWQHFEAEFEYNQDRPAQQWLLASFTTNPTPGGSKGDYLTIDNVEFIYYHALSALSYEGATIAFDEATTSYDLRTEVYDPAKLSYTVKGVAAVAETAFNAATGQLTITVKGDDFSVNSESVTTYTLQFRPSLTISTSRFATFYVPHAYVVPEGVLGGYVTTYGAAAPDADGTLVTALTYAWPYTAGSVVPAETPLILHAQEELTEAKTYYYEIAASADGAHVPQENYLHGVLEDGTMTYAEGAAQYYKMTYGGPNLDKYGFWWGAANGGPFAFPANKCFLALPEHLTSEASLSGLMLEPGGEVNAITGPTLSTPAAPTCIFTLDGRRLGADSVDQLPAGLYIVNGQKVLVR